MSPAKRKAVFSTDQGELFAALSEPAVIGNPNARDLDIGAELIGALSKALREARQDENFSRDRIADRMNLTLPEGKKKITRRQVDSWMAMSKEFHELPARYLPALCWALDTDEPLRVIAKALGFELIDVQESAAMELGETHLQIARLRRRVGLLSKTLGAE